MPTLFLDFDGVMNPVGGDVAPLEYSPLLVQLLAPHPKVRVVLSTSWVWTFGFEDTKAMLPRALQRRIIGTTYNPAYKSEKWWLRSSRYQQIAHYVERYRVERWLAIDDDDDGWPPELRRHLVCPPKDVGLASADVQADLADKLRSLTA